MRNFKPLTQVSIALVAGLAGGILASRPWTGRAFAAARHSKTLSAEQFVLIDRDGTRRGLIQVASNGAASLTLYDRDGRSRAELETAPDGAASLGFYDEGGRRR